MPKKSKSRKRWFWAYLIQMTLSKAQLRKPSARTEVWKNLVIIQARNANEAFAKAWKIGKAESGDCQGTLRLNNKPALTQFLGVADMGLIYDELSDGAEILWHLGKCTRKSARLLVSVTPSASI
jgi:hypothetical protein